ncbi:MAG: MBL fold metallo-hydrolase [Spirochaetaceae bacterium]|nr:MBL fold metallo-hydrolase [Spirochaetaceae bacterium]
MFELIQAGEHTFYIDCPTKIGIYRLPDNKIILIDSGNDKDAARKVLKIIKEHNWILDTIINTHSHADHIGGNKFLSDRTGCKIYAHGIEISFCRDPILEPDFIFGGFSNKNLHHKFLLAEASTVRDIAEFGLPQNMEIIPLKGHFYDMIGVKTPDNVYFMADCVMSESLLAKYNISFIYDIAEYLKTLDMIKTLNGALFIPAHTQAVTTMETLANVNKQKVLEIIESIKHICKTPMIFEDILKNLCDKYNHTMDMTQYALVGSTLKSYLSYMLNNDMLKTEIQNNYLLWHYEPSTKI